MYITCHFNVRYHSSLHIVLVSSPGHGGGGDPGGDPRGPGDAAEVRAHHAAQAPGAAAGAAAVAGAQVADAAAPRGGATAAEEQRGRPGNAQEMPNARKFWEDVLTCGKICKEHVIDFSFLFRVI